MQQIDSWIELARAIDDPQLADIRSLLVTRRNQLADDADELSDLAIITVLQQGDTLRATEAKIGFPIATNFIDGTQLGEPDFTPSWEYAERHPSGWTEIVFVLTDDGFGHVILVPDSDALDTALTQLCQLADQIAASAQQTMTR